MASGIDYANLPQDKKLATQALDIEKNDKELERKLGSLGKLFGYGNNVVLYIIALITIFLVLIAAIYSFIPLNENKMTPIDLWKILSPFITAGFGFIAGKNGKIDSNIHKHISWVRMKYFKMHKIQLNFNKRPNRGFALFFFRSMRLRIISPTL